MSKSNLKSPLYETINKLIGQYDGDIEKLRDEIGSSSSSIMQNMGSKLQVGDVEKAFDYFANDDLSDSEKKEQEKNIAKDFVDFYKGSESFSFSLNDDDSAKNSKINKKRYGQFQSILISVLKGDFDLPLQNKELPIYVYLKKIFKSTFKVRTKDLYTGTKRVTKNVTTERGKEIDYTVVPPINQNIGLLTGLVKDNIGNQNSTDIFETKYIEKLDRYYRMYESVLAKRIQTDMLAVMSNNSDLGLEELSNIFKEKIKNLLDEFLYILYAFGDKISVSDLDNILQGKTTKTDKEDQNDQDEVVGNDQFGEKRYTSILGFTSNIISRYEKLKGHPELVTLYRTFAQDGITIEDGRRVFSNGLISGKIEDHFGESLDNLLDIYMHWFYSAACSEENLLLIKEKIDILFEGISVLNENAIAFTSHNYNPKKNVKYLKERYGNIINNKLKKNLEKEMFEDLLGNKVNNSEIIETVKDKRSDDLSFIESTEEPGKYKDLTFDELSGHSTLKRKKYFLENVLEVSKDKKTIKKTHKLFDVFTQNSVEYDSFTDFYADYYKKHGNTKADYDNLFKDAIELIENGGTTLQFFEESKIPYEQILVGWFRYTLMYKKYHVEGESKEDVNNKIKEEFDAVYGNSHLIMSYLDKDIIEKNNIQIISGNINNSHVGDIKYMSEKWDKGHSKRWKNLKNIREFGYEREIDGEVMAVKFNSIEGLYLPQDKEKGEVSFDEILKFNEGFLDFCNLDLQKESIPEKYQKYRRILTENGIDVMNDNIITNLRKFYKYTLSLHEPVQKMYEDAIENREFLEELQAILHEAGIKITIGGSKSAYRTFQKGVCDYNGDIRRLQDLLRGRNVEIDYLDSVENVSKVIEILYTNPKLKKQILQVLIGDNTGNPSEKSEKPTGYRDLGLDIKLASGNVVELQFQLKGIYDFKEDGLDPSDLVYIFRESEIKLTKKEYIILEQNAEKEGLKIPFEFKQLCGDKNYKFKSSVHGYSTDSDGNQNEKITSTWFYDMWRGVKDAEPEYVKKIQKMESLPNLIAWGKVVHNLSKSIFDKSN